MSKIKITEIKRDSSLSLLKESESASVVGGIGSPNINVNVNLAVATPINTGIIVQNSFGDGFNSADLGQFSGSQFFQNS